jgi:hypothetical protein
MRKKDFVFKLVYLGLFALLIMGFLSCGVSTKEEGEKGVGEDG